MLKDACQWPVSLNFICCPIYPCSSLLPFFPLCCHGYTIPMATGGLYGWPQAPLQRTLWTFLYPFPSSSLTNHTSRMHNTFHLCLDLTPHIYLRATPFSFCMPVLRCTKAIMFWSIVHPAVLCKSTGSAGRPENLTVGIRSNEIRGAGTAIRFVVCTVLKLESVPQAF